jgi:hypothetical protein
MSLGGDFSSNQTNKLSEQAIQCSIPKLQSIAYSNRCCYSPGYQPSARYPSMVINKYNCPPPTPAEFALFPKVAVPSSVRIQNLIDGKNCSLLPDSNERFAQYRRYNPPVPCPPLSQLAASAGISKPSNRECNIYPRF